MAAFPPTGPTTLQRVIAAYLYQEYADDDNLQGLVQAQNQTTQDYVQTLNDLNLPVYTQLTGSLLDWVGQGLYGIMRPVLPSNQSLLIGPLNTYELNTIPLNQVTRSLSNPEFVIIGGGIGEFVIGLTPIGGITTLNPTFYSTDDDGYKRVITWNFYKGDGNRFNLRWLKRRVMRFLLGTDGVDFNVDQTYRVSVSFGADGAVNIRVINNIRTITGGAILNDPSFVLNQMELNGIRSSNFVYPSLPLAPVMKAAIEAGVLQLPFQFAYIVNVT